METWHLWALAGIALLIVEIFTISFFFASFAAAAFCTAVAAGQDVSFTWQLVTFAMASVISLVLLRPLAGRLRRSSDPRTTNCHAMIGQTGTVADPIGGAGQFGRVKIRSEEWRARTFDDTPAAPGALVEILAVDGSTLTVRQLS